MSMRSLIAAADSILVVIDVQPPFLRKLAPADADRLRQRVCWLIGVAHWLAIPLVVTAEDIPHEGSVDAQIAQSLPPDTPIYNKMSFDLTGEPAIEAAVRNTQRMTAVVVGLETDVCVAQSVLGLLGSGYHAAVVADATGAPGSAHTFGLERIRQAGGAVVSVKGLFYEWVRTVECAHRFRQECPQLAVPEGLQL
jgi:nicotinamidase-related amidase